MTLQNRLHIFILCVLLFLVGAHPVQAQRTRGIDTFHFYFNLDVAALDKNIQRKVDLLIYNNRIINGSEIRIIGYADYLGSDHYNKNLSMERARNLKKYLVKYGIDAGSITVCTGKGEVKRHDTAGAEGSPTDRKVDIVVNNGVNMSEKWDKKIKTTHKSPSNTPATSKTGGNGTDKGGNTKNDNTTGKGTDVGGGTGTDKVIKELTTLKVGQTILLRNVYFPAGSHIIKTESFPTLAKLYQTLSSNPQLQINIEGHVCCIHDVPDAMDIETNEPLLSVNRARAIYDYLVERGIDPVRLKYEGFGKSHPVVANERTEEDAERNRRVEIRVTGN